MKKYLNYINALDVQFEDGYTITDWNIDVYEDICPTDSGWYILKVDGSRAFETLRVIDVDGSVDELDTIIKSFNGMIIPFQVHTADSGYPSLKIYMATDIAKGDITYVVKLEDGQYVDIQQDLDSSSICDMDYNFVAQKFNEVMSNEYSIVFDECNECYVLTVDGCVVEYDDIYSDWQSDWLPALYELVK